MARSTGGRLSRFSIFGELWTFMRVRKKWWRGPIVFTMILLSSPSTTATPEVG